MHKVTCAKDYAIVGFQIQTKIAVLKNPHLILFTIAVGMPSSTWEGALVYIIITLCICVDSARSEHLTL